MIRSICRSELSFLCYFRFLLLTLFLCSSRADAAVSYAADLDMPTLNPTHIERDSVGRVWIAESSNLSWFDGHRFQRETPLEKVSTAPNKSKPKWGAISDLLAIDDWLLVAHAEGVSAFDLKSWRWHALIFPGKSPGIGAIAVHQGQVFLAGANLLYSINLPAPDSSNVALIARQIQGAWPDKALKIRSLPSGLYGLNESGFFRYLLAENRVEKIEFDLPALDNGARFGWSISEWPAGQLWLGYWNDGLVKLDLASNKARWLHPQQVDTGGLRSTSIYDFLTLGSRLLIATNRGLVYYQSDCDCFRGLNLPNWDAVEGSGIVVDELASAEQADQHGFWASVLGEGLVRFDYNDFYISNQVRVDQLDNSLDKGLRNNIVRALTLAPNAGATFEQKLLVGTYGGGVQLARYRPFGQLWNMPRLSYSSERIEGKYLWWIQAKAPNSLILSTGDGVFAVADQLNQGTSQLIDPKIKSARCSALLGDTLWVGTVRGLFKTSAEAALTVKSNATLSPVSGAQTAIFSCAQVANQVWFGSAMGLLRFDAKGVLLPALVLPESSANKSTASPNAKPVVVFAQSHGDAHWLATNQGIIRAIPNGKTDPDWNLVLETDNIQNARSIALDNADRVWMGTSKGLIQFDPKSRQQLNFNAADGLFGYEFNIGAMVFDGKYLHAGGNGGVSSFDPALLRARSANLVPRIERLRIGLGEWQRPQALALPARHAPVEITFASNDYPRPKQLRYSVRLQSNGQVTADWLELGSHADFLLERLPAGAHQLWLRVEALDVPGSAAQRMLLELEVEALWFQRPAVWALAFLSLIALGFGLGNLRNRWLQEQGAKLRRQVEEQTLNLRQNARELRERNAQLETLSATDPLTGLANRRRLFHLLSSAHAPVAILAFDLDHFKKLNDDYGHAAGDAVLVQFADLLQRFEPKKLAARIGGEEFVLVLDIDIKHTARAAAENLLTQTRALKVESQTGVDLQFTVSIGVLENSEGLSPDEYMRKADQALYQAKRTRNAISLA